MKIFDKNIVIFTNFTDVSMEENNFLFSERFVAFIDNVKICDL